MTYQGSKEKIADLIVSFLEGARQPHQIYCEPFVGSCSIFERMSGPKIGGDAMRSLIILWNELILDTFEEPTSVTKEQYTRLMKDPTPSALQAYVGFFWSFSGMYNKGYSPNFYANSRSFYEAQQRAKRIREGGQSFILLPQDYRELDMDNVLVYCDIPYKGTTPYKGAPNFDHDEFYHWCHLMKRRGNTVFISEYEMPADLGFYEVMEIPFRTSMNTVKRTVEKPEKIFTL